MKRQRNDTSDSKNSQADVARKGLVSLNKLDYNLNPDLSVVVHRSAKKHFFQQPSYTPGSKAIVICNSGSEYVDPQNSYISFTVEHTATATDTNLGIGSGANFIKHIILTTRSGDEIERVEEANRLAIILDRYSHSKNWIDSVGSMTGYLDTSEFSNHLADVTHQPLPGVVGNVNNVTLPGANPSGDHRDRSDWLLSGGHSWRRSNTQGRFFVIPLSCVSGLFRSYDKLLPPHLMSGLRIEIHFEAAKLALKSTNTAPTYVIKDLELTLDQYQLTDSIQRVLNEEATLRGLEIPFTTFYNHRFHGNGNKANVEVRKAVSRALGILTKVSPLIETKDDCDHMKSVPFTCTKYQVRVGSLYFPQQPIKVPTGTADTEHKYMEFFHHTLRGLGKLKSPAAPPAVRYVDFEGISAGEATAPTDNTEGGIGAMYTDLERSNVQRLTGIPINNSRVAEVQMEGTTNAFDSTTKQIDVYLHYVRLLRVFLQNVEIEE